MRGKFRIEMRRHLDPAAPAIAAARSQPVTPPMRIRFGSPDLPPVAKRLIAASPCKALSAVRRQGAARPSRLHSQITGGRISAVLDEPTAGGACRVARGTNAAKDVL